MKQGKQLSFSDLEVMQNRKSSRTQKQLEKIDKLVEWGKMADAFAVINKSGTSKGGRPRKEVVMMIKLLYIQYLYNLSDPELEEQVNDRLSFQQFVGISMQEAVPDYTTIWRFKEALIRANLLEKMFSMIMEMIEGKGLLVKKGTMVDATIIPSTNKPLSKEKRETLEKKPSSQIDTEARSTEKNGKKYFGYKGHVGVDLQSKIIRRRKLTPANVHDRQVFEELVGEDERSWFGDKAYADNQLKKRARKEGIYYGILDKATRSKGLSGKQEQRNMKKSKVRAAVEYVFLWMKTKFGYVCARARTLLRNQLAFDMNCILYNLLRASYLLGLNKR